MTSASEVFVVQLSRASASAHKFLRKRGVQGADRDDVIAGALLWCWTNRDNYTLTGTLEQWFVGAVRHAYRDWMAGNARNASEYMAEIPTGDTTYAKAEAMSGAQALMRALPREYRRVALMELQGYTRAEMMEKGVSRDGYDAARERIKQLRRLVPDEHEYRHVLRTMPAPDVYEGAWREPSRIDSDIAALDFPPPSGKECPPCWRCKWFEGYMPGTNVSVRMQIQEAEVREAVRNTEAEKIRIAQGVRDGSI